MRSAFCYLYIGFIFFLPGTNHVSVAGQIKQQIFDESELGPPSEIEFEPFQQNVDGIARILTGVGIEYNGQASMDVVIENFSPAAYGPDEWYYDVFHSVLLSFDAKPGYPDGGPFFFMGGVSIENITGPLSPGMGGGFPFPGGGEPGETVVNASAMNDVNATFSLDPSAYDYFLDDQTIKGKIGSFTEGLLTPPEGGPIQFPMINSRITSLLQSGQLDLIYDYQIVGDVNSDDQLDASDIDRLYVLVNEGNTLGDLNGDSGANQADVDLLVEDLLGTVYGDSNLDGQFDSSDLVQVFQRSEFEDNVVRNSTWASGDWNGDREFSSSDLVFVFEKGSYELNAATAVVANVPEPNSILLLLSVTPFILCFTRRRPIRPVQFP